MRKLIIIIIISLMAIGIALLSIFRNNDTNKDTYKLSYPLEIRSKDPAQNMDGWTTSISRQLTTTLLTTSNNNIEKFGAQEIKKLDDKSMDITIRNDLYWEDGKKITSQDYINGFKHVIDKTFNNIYANWVTDYIDGGKEAFKSGGNIKGIKKLSDTKFNIKLVGNYDNFYQILSTNVFSPLREDILNKYGKKYGTAYKYYLSSGIYRVSKFTRKVLTKLTLNKYSPFKNKVKYKNLDFIYVRHGHNNQNLYEKNKIDNFIQNEDINKISNSTSTKVNSLLMQYLIFNNKKVDLNTRILINNSLDKKYINKTFNNNLNYPRNSIFPKNLSIDISASSKKINKLKDNKKLKLLVSISFNQNILKYIKSQLEKVNIDLEIVRSVDSKISKELFSSSHDYDLIISSWTGPYTDKINYVNDYLGIDTKNTLLNTEDTKLKKLITDHKYDEVDRYINENINMITLWQEGYNVINRNDNVHPYSPETGNFKNALFW